MSTDAALAFSYLRFSHPDQAKGDSVRRQTELRDAWLARNGVTLDTSLTLEDKGVSGFRGKHRDNPDRHALAAFVALVKKGRIRPGSFLIVESLDRLSREDILPALSLLIDLIQSGIRIVQLLPVEVVYDKTANPMQLMMAIMELSRGHSESAMKSERIGGAWREKKRRAAESKEVVTKRAPAWLRLVDGEWQANEAAVVIIRRIYALATDGHGLSAITKRLNAEKVPTLGGADDWPRSYVHKLLLDRRLLGEYQPHTGRGPKRQPDGPPVQGYYPAVLTEDEYYAARAGLASRRAKPGRTPKGHVNVFSGLLHDALAGGSLQHTNKGGTFGRRLESAKALLGVKGPHCCSFPFEIFERAVLSLIREIDPGDVLPDDDRGAEELAAQMGRLATLEGEIAKLQGRLQTRYSDAVADVLQRQEAEHQRVLKRLAELRQEAASPLGLAWQECVSLVDAIENAPDPGEARVKLRAALRRIVEGFWVVVIAKGSRRVAAVQARFTGGRHRDFLIVHRRGTAGAVGSRPERWAACSLPCPDGATDLDLRTRKSARDMAAMLRDLDIEGMLDLRAE